MSELRIQYNTDIRTPTSPDDPSCYNANGLPILDELGRGRPFACLDEWPAESAAT